jgi:N-acetylmuramoyl-L-alanine amidase
MTPSAIAVEIQDVRLWRSPDKTRIVLDLNGAAAHSVLELDNPRRLVVDLKDTQLAAPLTDLPLTGTPIARLRSGVRQGHDLRLVFDLTAYVQPKSFALPPSERTGHRLVIDLFDKASATTDNGPTEPLGTPVAASSSLPPSVVKSIDDLSGMRDIIVAIDAGHGGEDPGAIGPNKLREKDVVLNIARRLKARLQKIPGIKPVMIRDGDYYVSLRGRRELARKYQADIFVSIHADAFTKSSANGASVYMLSTRGASSATAQLLADRENAADLIGGVNIAEYEDDVAFAITDLTMDYKRDHSVWLGDEVLKDLGDVARLHKQQLEEAAFAVLKTPGVPSILVETGFISNPGESRKLATSSYQERMARAIEQGIVRYAARYAEPGTLFASRRTHGGGEYVVVSGDTLSEIASRFRVSVQALKSHNQLNGNTIRVGQKLTIPEA